MLFRSTCTPPCSRYFTLSPLGYTCNKLHYEILCVYVHYKIHLSVQLNLFNASSFHHLLRLELSPNARDRKRKRKALTIKASWTAFKSCMVSLLTSLKPGLKLLVILGSALLQCKQDPLRQHEKFFLQSGTIEQC